ncbi:Alpha/Beta hydrolase protein [Rhodocollybia butyracea]|uniref:Alpha/Beta hydrolase protein n=1 Tax=Rhodocollybia butyracea TaxID=206335 RepID=A0A9P5P6N4_9AGAR|nr:Alpha/Beta hydrolase protein [Rhodocollybia butyracea]
MVSQALLPVLTLVFSLVSASPAVQVRQAITTLSTAQIDAFTPYAFFANTGYCSPSTTISWSCGANCNANPGFIPVAAGGDGSDTQFYFVGYDPSLDAVIVSHQGTDPEEIEDDLTDLFQLTAINPSLFPGVSSSVEVHNGFGDEQAMTAPTILAAVQQAMSEHGTNSVTTTGHSLGAALSLLDALYLKVQIPSASVKFIGFGLPRVGNQAFANLIDSTFPGLVTHINNKEDPVPTLPGEFLGFVHPSGENHIMDSNAWVACPGQDNPSTECTTGDVPNIFDGTLSDHDGPYNGVTMGVC